MTNWKVKVTGIATVLESYDATGDLAATADGIANILKTQVLAPEFPEDTELEHIISEFEDAAQFDGSAEDVEQTLNDLYDWADDNQVWLEPFDEAAEAL